MTVLTALTKLSALVLGSALTAAEAQPSPAEPCPLSAPVLQGKAVQARWATDGAPIVVGQHFAIDIQLCPKGAQLKRVDAAMPEHRHGMNYRVSLTPMGEGRWLAKGLLFHMPGRWELRLDVALDGTTEKLTQSIEQP